MVNINQVQRGVTEFIDREVIPHLSGYERIMLGTGAGLLSAKLPNIMDKVANNTIFSAMDLYNKNTGEVDLDAVYKAARPYIGSESFPVKIPVVGITLKMGQKEIDDLYRYIKEA